MIYFIFMRHFIRRTMRLSKRILLSGFILVVVLAFLNLFDRIDHLETHVTDEVHKVLCSKINQTELEYIASYLEVQVVAKEAYVTIFLKNIGFNDILNCYWEIYFSLIALPLNPTFHSDVFKVHHVNGFLFRLSPHDATNVNVLIRKEGMKRINVACRLVSKHFIFPNWLITGPDMDSLLISSTSMPYFLERVSMDPTETSVKRFNFNKLAGVGIPAEPKLVIPTPLHIFGNKPFQEYIAITDQWSIHYNSNKLSKEASMMRNFFGMRDDKNSNSISTGQVIFLNLVEITHFKDVWMDGMTAESGTWVPESPEAYKITTFASKIVLQAMSPTGIFYGIQTIISLCGNNQSKEHIKLMPALNITDAPKYKYRGLMIDVARHFLDVNCIKKFITAMSIYKMNHLHLHLTDDEGWRIEIPSLPELTRVGANPTVRFNSQSKFDFLNAYLGALPLGKLNDTKQFYTRDDYRDILRHAALHHVTVVPEIDFPGHSHAALVSMRSRKNKLKKVEVTNSFISNEDDISKIEDENDTSIDSSINNVADTVINICRISTIKFMRVVISTIISYHEGIQHLKMIHLGGDEVSERALTKSPICNSLLQEKATTLRSYVMKKLLEFGSLYHVRVILWESHQREINLVSSIAPIIHFWLPSQFRNNIVKKYIRAGFDVILSEGDTFYLDHPYESCSHEAGLRWATNHINEMDIFKYTPPNLCFLNEENCADQQQHIIGIQANLWGELILESQQAEYMVFPRLLAVAERAWHQASWQNNFKKDNKEIIKDWSSFAQAVAKRELSVLEDLSINYRIPPPGARMINGKLEYNTLFPGLPVIKISSNKFENSTLLATTSINGSRLSRIIGLGM